MNYLYTTAQTLANLENIRALNWQVLFPVLTKKSSGA